MKKKIGFFSGARSEYGIMKGIIKRLEKNPSFNYELYISGMHLLDSMGNTIKEINQDKIKISNKIYAFKEKKSPNYIEFTKIINDLSQIFKKNKINALFLIGDRIETYAAALAAHFCGVQIIHCGGGAITKGSLDNIYRYNISNLSKIHLITSLKNYERLKKNSPKLENLFFTGSFAIDSIMNFKKNPKPLNDFIPKLKKHSFCLMTFHPTQTIYEDIPEIMDVCIKYLLEKGIKILITYPNNDYGYQKIIEVIKKWENNTSIFIQKNLGSQNYYSALNDCLFVIGNSSSGIIEAPYFNKTVINIGSRQEGREIDEGVFSIKASSKTLIEVLDKNFKKGWATFPCNYIYGKGDSIKKIVEIIDENV